MGVYSMFLLHVAATIRVQARPPGPVPGDRGLASLCALCKQHGMHRGRVDTGVLDTDR